MRGGGYSRGVRGEEEGDYSREAIISNNPAKGGNEINEEFQTKVDMNNKGLYSYSSRSIA